MAGKRRDFCANFARSSYRAGLLQAPLREDVCQQIGRFQPPQPLCASGATVVAVLPRWWRNDGPNLARLWLNRL